MYVIYLFPHLISPFWLSLHVLDTHCFLPWLFIKPAITVAKPMVREGAETGGRFQLPFVPASRASSPTITPMLLCQQGTYCIGGGGSHAGFVCSLLSGLHCGCISTGKLVWIRPSLSLALFFPMCLSIKYSISLPPSHMVPNSGYIHFSCLVVLSDFHSSFTFLRDISLFLFFNSIFLNISSLLRSISFLILILLFWLASQSLISSIILSLSVSPISVPTCCVPLHLPCAILPFFCPLFFLCCFLIQSHQSIVSSLPLSMSLLTFHSFHINEI